MCTDNGNVPDGTSCGNIQVCNAGACVYAVPTIASLNPSGGVVNKAVTVIGTGTGFVPGVSTVQLNGTNHAATVDSTTQFTLPLSTTDTQAAGSSTITVTNPGAGSSAPVIFTFYNTTTINVTKSCPSKAVQGGTIYYTLSAVPTGSEKLLGPQLSDLLPSGTVLAAGGDIPRCMGVALGASGTLTCKTDYAVTVFFRTFNVQTDANTLSPVHNKATAVAVNAPQVDSNDCQTILTPAPGAVPVLPAAGNKDSFVPYLVGDPFVAFSSDATDLVANDTNNARDVFVACVAGGTTSSCPTPSIVRASVASDGGQLDAGVPAPVGPFPVPSPITADGRFVVFASADPNVVTPATSGTQIYARDTCVGATSCTPTTFLASAKSTGGIGSTSTDSPSVSANGRVVAFYAGSFYLPPSISGFQIFARDTCFGAASCTPTTVLVSADNSGTAGNGFSNHPSVSGDGRFVAFESNSKNLVPTTSTIPQQIFLRDTCIGAPAGCTPAIALISANSSGAPGNGYSQNPSVNGDGRFVAFYSQSSDILPGNTAAGRPDVFLRDTCGGSGGPLAGCTPSTIRVSVALDGTQANGGSTTGLPGSSISATGRFIAFGSGATNLLTTPSTAGQVYVLDTCFGAPAGCTRALHKVTVDSAGSEVGSSGQFSISGDGTYLSFTQLVGTAPNQIQKIFLTTTGFVP